MRILCLIAVLLLLTPLRAAAQVGATTDILRGRVLAEEGTPIQGALVEAWSAETGVRRATTSGADGFYTLLFPDGGGRYRLRVSHLGRAPYEAVVARVADEEVLLHDVRLATRPVEVQGVVAQGRRTLPPGRGEAGSQGRGVGGDLTGRLPLQETDAAALAGLVPGVVPLGVDSVGGAGSFSVAGQRASQNQVTLDGASFASMLSGGALGGGLGLPQEGMRSTQVITNTYDVARGQFSGGQVAMTTQAGTNTRQGSLSYLRRDDRLQAGTGMGEWSDGFRQNRLSGGIGGPLLRDRLFYNFSFAGRQREDGLFALEPRSDRGFDRLGADPDSVARFLDILSRVYGVPDAGLAGGYARSGDGLSALGRIDFHATPRHSLALRGFGAFTEMRNAFIRPLDALENGGQMSGRTGGLVGTVTSQFGASWVNEARLSYTAQAHELSSTTDLPEGRVHVSSLDVNGGTRVSSLAFGGDPALPREASERTLELANEVSWLAGSWHRIKLGALFNLSRFEQEAAIARNGVFTFESLEDLEQGRPTSFTRSLLSGPTSGSGWNAALYVGDTWRLTDALQVVFGGRLEASGFGERPVTNAAAVEAFGLDTERLPSEVRLSPRAGFSWRLSGEGRPARVLRGGFGEFRGRTPFSLYAGVLDAARQDGEALLSCVGPGVVPAADFELFRTAAAAIPTSCADGSAGGSATAARPTVTGFAPDFQAPRSWRGSLGYEARLRPTLSVSLDANYARGLAQYGVRDLNLADAPAFRLEQEADRPVYAPAAAIQAGSGTVPLAASRRDPGFAAAYEVHSELESEAAALTMALNGLLIRWRASFQIAYTLSTSRDQSSFTFGGPAQGFAGTVTGGDPNRPGWAPGAMDRRHAFSALLGMPLGRGWDVSLVGRAASGAPYTPRVSADVNGDGFANDAAFVFDPAGTADAALATAMQRLLDSAPSRAADCLITQLGSIAGRNSCRGDWSLDLDLRIAHTPRLGPLGQRLSVGLDVYSLPAGLDLLLHGRENARGWGQGGLRHDDVLLRPRGFDAQSRSFAYEVNQNFGRRTQSMMGMQAPFGLQLTGRLAVGPDRGRDPLGGFAGIGLGGAGGAGGGGVVMVTRTAGEAPPPGGATIRVAGAAPGRAGMLDRLLPMPLDSIVALADSLDLSPEQRTRLEEIRAELRELNTPIRAEVGRALSGGAAVPTDNPALLFERIGPRLNEGRLNVQRALDRVRAALTPEQWERIPVELREAANRQVRIGSP